MTDKKEEYKELCQALKGLIEDESDALANLANSAALIYNRLEQLNWAGFYLYKENQLILGPFQGKPACIRIALGRGVCGTAALNKEPLLVKDVHQFQGHIACDEASLSEVVIPIVKKDKLIGVLDLDSPIKERFDTSDLEGLLEYVGIVTSHIQFEQLLS